MESLANHCPFCYDRSIIMGKGHDRMLAFYLSLIDSPEARTKFENIYYSYRSVMFHSANQVLHNAHDAEDIVADSFLAVINILDAIDSTDEDKHGI